MLTDDQFTLQDSNGRRNRILHLPATDPLYDFVEKRFEKGWKHPDKPKPPVHAIFKIQLTKENLEAYQKYRTRVEASPIVRVHPNSRIEKLLFHGTNRRCLLADDKSRTRLCELPECHLCRIVGSSFDIAKCGMKHQFRRFGTGIYSTSCSSKADDYVVDGAKKSTFRVMLASRVIVGKPFKRRQNGTGLTGPPPGYHSIVGKPGIHLNYPETVVYDNDAIRPAFLVVYGFPPEKDPNALRSVISKLFKTPIAS
ncbi:putative poly(ADP-ribose) polymerase catalytic domain [Lyophyllum shimeji]|uniref:Poly [ADP-ribose] polymerase n=1 Tax=Lyophyllum shimeji TaxID=47721 RepID=A0A9P3US09_LYOSH|nr:putative poly(ADP-ribose) polymerase catalytic domain [Lyophyllum shimeji]